jgi:Asp-tRNA(Asn)/Glu-tRNA(Gln) amidotransferase A subunit family amidase
MATDPAPFVSMARPDLPEDWPYKQWPYRATRMRRMRDGMLQPIEVDVHPDPRVQRVLEQIREAEATQGIDRVRPVFHRCDIVALNNLVLDLTYDATLSHRDLVAGGDRITRALERAGVLPETPDDLVLAYPDLFASASTARRDIREWRAKMGSDPKRTPICGLTPFIFRRAGQRGRLSRVWVSTQHADAKAAAEAVLGPLVTFAHAAHPVPQQAPEPAPVDVPATAEQLREGGLRPVDDVPRWIPPWMIDQENAAMTRRVEKPPDG